jgi:hypothetical protein
MREGPCILFDGGRRYQPSGAISLAWSEPITGYVPYMSPATAPPVTMWWLRQPWSVPSLFAVDGRQDLTAKCGVHLARHQQQIDAVDWLV